MQESSLTREEPPRHHGHYELLRQLGEGGMGTVWLARHVHTGKEVALKLLSEHDARHKARFRHEIKTLSNLNHPGIVRFVESSIAHTASQQTTPHHELWYAMELLEGRPLSWHLEQMTPSSQEGTPRIDSHRALTGAPAARHKRPTPPTAIDEARAHTKPPAALPPNALSATPLLHEARSLQALREALATTLGSSSGDFSHPNDSSPVHLLDAPEPIRPTRDVSWPDPALVRQLGYIAELCQTLAVIHGEGIVHCDLKPENIVITRQDDRAILVDFGIADRFGARVEHEVLEGAGLQAGTAYYISPEQIRGEPVDARTDLYGLGCILYEILTGAPPFFDGPPMSILLKHLAKTPTPLHEIDPNIPQELSQLCASLLQKDPVHRIGHALSVARKLSPWLDAPRKTLTASSSPTKPYLYRARLTGREPLFQAIEASLQAVKRSEALSLLLGGESGVGKSSVAQELISRARSHDFVVMSTYCRALETGPTSLDTERLRKGHCGPPLHAFEPILRQIVDEALEHPESDTAQSLQRHLHLLRPYSRALKELPTTPLLSRAKRHSPDRTKNLVLSALYKILSGHLHARPALLLIDDAHHIDPLSLDALLFIERHAREERKPWFLTILYASDEPTDTLRPLLVTTDDTRDASHRAHHRIERLDAHATRSLCAQMLGVPDPEQQLVEHVHRQTQGNPFLVAEYLRLAMERGQLHMDHEGRWHLDDHSRVELLDTPESIQHIIQDRLQRLSPEELSLCQIASIFGMHFHEEQLLALLAPTLPAKKKRATLTARILELVQREILDDSLTHTYGFTHTRLHHFIYHGIPTARREELHLEAALWLGTRTDAVAAEVATHYELARRPLRAAEIYRQAANQALAQHAYEQAAELHERALEQLDALALPPEQELDHHTHRLALVQEILLPARKLERAEAHLEIILSGARKLDASMLRARALVLLGQTCMLQGRTDRAERLLDEVMQRFEALASGEGKADTLYQMARLALIREELEQARQLADLARQTYLRVRHREGQARASLLLGELCWRLGRSREAISTFEQAVTLHQRLGNQSGQTEAFIWLAHIHCTSSQHKKTAHYLEKAHALAIALNDPSSVAQTLIIRARRARQKGQLLEAIAHLEEALSQLELTHDPHHHQMASEDLAALRTTIDDTTR